MKHITISSKVNRTISFQGKEWLYFSGTAYLGMGTVPEMEALAIEGLQKYGLNFGASRFSNVQLDVYKEFENLFQKKTGAEKALVLSSGYLAGNMVSGVLAAANDVVLIAPKTHPAIMPFGHQSAEQPTFSKWVEEVATFCQRSAPLNILLMANAVDPLHPEIHEFDWVRNLPSKHAYTLLIDDSHAFGVVGEDLFGTYARWKGLPIRLAVSGSLGKGLGISAGIICGDHGLIQELEKQPIFRGASPPSPGPLYAFLKGQNYYSIQRNKLRTNLDFLYSSLKQKDHLHFHPAYPVLRFDPQEWVEQLEDAGILLSSFPYPSPQDPAVNRLIPAAYHEQKDLVHLAEILNSLS